MMKTKTIKVSGKIDVHPDGDIYICCPKEKRFYYAGSIADKDLDENGFIVSVGGKFIRKFIKVLKMIEVK